MTLARFQEGRFTGRTRRGGGVRDDAIVILDVFSKKTRTLPGRVAATAKRRLKEYLRVVPED